MYRLEKLKGKEYLRELEGDVTVALHDRKETRRDRVDWIQMAQDRNHWWTLVTTAPAGRLEPSSCSDLMFLNWYTCEAAVVT
jgi:hypothetical protein